MLASDNLLPCTLILVGSLAIILTIYCILTIRCNNAINILTPFLLAGIPILFLLEFAHLLLFGYDGSLFAYSYIYSIHTVGVLAEVIGFLAMPSVVLPLFLRVPRILVPGAPYLFLGFGFALYAPIIIEHIDLITSPREIYALTRVGHGIETFLSSFCVYVGLILLLFNRRNHSAFKIISYSVPAMALLYLHGSKGQVFFFFLIGLYFAVFVLQKRFGFFRLSVIGILISILMVSLFYLNSSENSRADLLESLAGYASEGIRNATLVVDDSSLEPQGGRLTLEDNYYSAIPRELFPDKRKDFGAFTLANRYFPERYQDERGAPTFDVGMLYADFGAFSILVEAFWQFLTGAVLKVLVTRLKKVPDVATFMVFLYLMDVHLIPTGTGFPFFPFYVITQIVSVFDRRLGVGQPTARPARAVSVSF